LNRRDEEEELTPYPLSSEKRGGTVEYFLPLFLALAKERGWG
jgi:hypothetical protein